MVIDCSLTASDYVSDGITSHPTTEVGLFDLSPLWVSADDTIAVRAHVELPHMIAKVPVCRPFTPPQILIQLSGNDAP